jgi:flavodoxin
MKALVVYESLWGNTAAIARAIAEGIGPDAQALATDAVSAGEGCGR